MAVALIVLALGNARSRAAPPAPAAPPTIEALRSSCEKKEWPGCRRLGQRLLRTPGFPPERRAEARALFRGACEGGDLDGCAEFGWSFATGLGGERNPARASALLRSACDRGGLDGCSKLGVLVGNGIGAVADTGAATALFRKACDGGNADGCDRLGLMYQTGQGVKQDAVRSLALLLKACAAGSGFGCNDLGEHYAKGDGVAHDERRACALFQSACEAGVPDGCSNLAFMYVSGRGVETDVAEATRLAEIACGFGGAFGCAKLGLLYLKSSDKAVRERGLDLLRRTCARDDTAQSPLADANLGNAEACAFLGEAYATGGGVTEDAKAALEFAKKACEHHYPRACDFARKLVEDRASCPANCQRLAKEGSLRDGMTTEGCIQSLCR